MKPLFSYFCLSLLPLFLGGCDREHGPIEITEVREIDLSNDFETPALAESDASRFRYRVKESAEEASGPPQLTWKTPEGWKEAEATMMREANLRFGENDEGECYVTRLSGMGGGMVANVNRWRKQVGAEELTEEEVAELPTKPLFGQPATLVSVKGDFVGMGSEPKTDYKLHGLILNIGGAMVTVKMTGPVALVEENEAKFDAFCASLDLRTAN